MIGFRKHGTYTRLLLSLVLVVVLTPFFNLFPGGRTILHLAFLSVIVSAVWDIARTPRLLMIGITLGIPALAVRLTLMVGDSHGRMLEATVQVLMIILFSYIIFEIIRDISGTSDVTRDTVRGSICAYLLMGLTWSLAYQLVVLFDPGAINVGTSTEALQEQNFTYFSFVVLTTLGFGDIAPVSGLARSLTWIEAVVGQLFIATTIARLVGMRMRSSE